VNRPNDVIPGAGIAREPATYEHRPVIGSPLVIIPSWDILPRVGWKNMVNSQHPILSAR